MNKWVIGTLIALFFLLAGYSLFLGQQVKTVDLPKASLSPTQSTENETQTAVVEDAARISVVAENLDTPWAIAFLPDTSMLVTERAGRVRFIDANGTLRAEPIATISDVKEIGEGGLLGIAVHPDFASNHFIYLYYTYNSTNNNTQNRVVRFTFANNTLSNRTVIVDAIPGASNHNGGRIAFGSDGFLYITTGDSQDPSLSQTTSSLAGKILRVTDDGSPVPGNPFGTRVYSYGHRNPQGIAWDSQGQLWSTEHGRSGIQSGLDELNKIESGKNYGWDIIQGDETRQGMVTPVLHSGSSTTWAPGGLAYLDGKLFFVGLRGQGLYEVVLQGDTVSSLKKHFDGELGRIRDVVVGPDKMLYITTSNRDGRGTPKENDDKVLRVNPEKL
ncbi:MAG TPA: PQQ-dependent sugar dehydrogenase [Patescibacteria group bacterium]|nr:PQQ-dependent sugar dehydrogenase [Patescibacteria group bacterium]